MLTLTAISQEQADDLFRASAHLDDLDDYYFDEETETHVYVLADASVVTIDAAGVMTHR